VLVAPGSMREPLIEEINALHRRPRTGLEARIAMKMNSLVDQRCIEALYRASQAGVTNCPQHRGICCLRPGCPCLDTMRVVSVVGGSSSTPGSTRSSPASTVATTSARPTHAPELDTRVELLARLSRRPPGRAPGHPRSLLRDDTNCWELHPDGSWNGQRRTRSSTAS